MSDDYDARPDDAPYPDEDAAVRPDDPDLEPEAADEAEPPVAAVGYEDADAEEMLDEGDAAEVVPPESAYAAVSEFDAEMEPDPDAPDLPPGEPSPAEPEAAADPAALEESERLRQPRARQFRQRLRNQVGMLPLALLLLALGGFLIAREVDVDGLPDLANLALAGIAVLVTAFTAVFRGLLSGRRERGLLFIGLWVGTTAGAVAVLVYGVEDQPDATEWWPLLLWSLSLALVLTYLVERTHDARLVLLSVVALVAGTTAYLVTSERIDQGALDDAAEYWPLLISIAGVGLLPLAFRRRTG